MLRVGRWSGAFACAVRRDLWAFVCSRRFEVFAVGRVGTLAAVRAFCLFVDWGLASASPCNLTLVLGVYPRAVFVSGAGVLVPVFPGSISVRKLVISATLIETQTKET